MTILSGTAGRLMSLTREGSRFRLTFRYREDLVERTRGLPFRVFDPDTKTTTCEVCVQSVEILDLWHYEGLLDVSASELIAPGEKLERCAAAVVRRGSRARPFVVMPAMRDDQLYSRLRAVPSATWEKKVGGLTYSPSAAAALNELVERGVISDPDRILAPAAITVTFDARTGDFKVLGDPRAQAAFAQHFPRKDVIDIWRSKLDDDGKPQLDVAFSDPFVQEIYQGELVRAGTIEIPPPEGLLLPLFPHQAQNVSLAITRTGICVFDEPGVGKTATGVAAGLELCVNRNEVPRTIIVCPGGLRTNWLKEIQRFTGHSDVVVVDGSVKDRHEAYEAAKEARWLVVHYDVLSRDLAHILPLSIGAFLVVDEVHRAKNPGAKRTQALRKIAKNCARRLGLSGTPVENVPDEWYGVLDLIVPGCLGGRYEFLENYMWKNRWNRYEGARNTAQLHQRSRVHYTRHRMEDVRPDLPPLVVQHLALDPDPKLATALKRAHREAREEIANRARARAERKRFDGPADSDLDEIETGAEMTAVGMLRALCSSPRLLQLSDSEAAQALVQSGLVPDEDGPKLDELRTMAAELKVAGQRVVIFSSSKRMVKLISERFTEDAIDHVTYTGDSSVAERDEATQKFTDPESGVVAFIATDAAAEGLNLGRCCNLLVNVDLPYTATRLLQRGRRIRRLDSQHPSYRVVNLTLRGTMEEGLLKMVEIKADLQDALFGESTARKEATGRSNRSRSAWANFEEALLSWGDEEDVPKPKAPRSKKTKGIAVEGHPQDDAA